MYNIVEAAAILSVPSAQLARWVARGRIPVAVLVDGPSGKVWRLPRDAVDQVARQLNRVARPTPMANRRLSATEPRIETPARPQTVVPWQQVERIVAKERTHWQRLAELQADTISSLRTQLEDAHAELLHLRERLAEMHDGDRNDALMGRSTLPLGRQDLVPLSFPQLEMPAQR